MGATINSPKDFQVKIRRWGVYLVDKFGLRKHFETIVFSGEYGKRKPDDELYLIFLEKSKAKPQNCYLVDDKLANLKEARFLLMKTIWRKNEEQDIQFIPDFVVKNINELKTIL